MLLNKAKPIIYPNKPPKTENIVQINAKIKAFVLLAIIIGIKIISGGIGKKELSTKEINAKNHEAFFLEDCNKVQSYKFLKSFINILFGRSRGNRTHTTEVTGF